MSRLELRDIRSYHHVIVELGPGVTVFVGGNGHGKTNLLEAVQRLAVGASHRTPSDGPLVRMGADHGLVRCEVQTDRQRRRTVELELGAGKRGRMRVDGRDVRRTSELVGVVRSVLFAPEDLAIVRGDPAERRRFLDDLLSQRRPAFAAARADYDRAVRQRNQLLKQARTLSAGSRTTATATLDTWTDQVVSHGTPLLAARLAAVRTLVDPADRFYRELADRPEPVGLRYCSSAGDATAWHEGGTVVPEPARIAAALRSALDEVAEEELARGLTLVGPHRDDVELTIGGLPARTHASQGEAWSLALALRLATVELLADIGDRPVVLLDDVFAELDTTRRGRLEDAIAGFDQLLVTAAVEADVPLSGRRVDVVLEAGGSRLHPRPVGTEGVA